MLKKKDEVILKCEREENEKNILVEERQADLWDRQIEEELICLAQDQMVVDIIANLVNDAKDCEETVRWKATKSNQMQMM